MLAEEITIERSPEIVWNYFTEPQNWGDWWGGEMKSAQWSQGGELVWTLGGSSEVLAITRGKMAVISGGWMDTTWTFKPVGQGKTVVRVQEGAPKGGACFSDGGASHLARLRKCLVSLKSCIEQYNTPKLTSEAKKNEHVNFLSKTINKNQFIAKTWKIALVLVLVIGVGSYFYNYINRPHLSTTSKNLLRSFPNDFPVYPNITKVQKTLRPMYQNPIHALTFSAKDERSKVLDYYAINLKSNGWSITKNDFDHMITCEKNELECIIWMVALELSDKSTTTINVAIRKK